MIELRLEVRVGAFSLDVDVRASGPSLALFGPSGCGKTTVLNAIAGLVRPARARVVIDGRVLVDTAAGVDLPARARRVGLVVQDGLLFPLLDVRQNLLFGAPKQGRLTLEAVADLLEVSHLLGRSPRHLSGGERQRVALGRAVLSEPSLLLCDEPFAALDAARRRRLVPILARLVSELSIPMVLVSHDVGEVLALADEVCVLAEGEVTEQGAPQALLETLAVDDRAALNFWEGTVASITGGLAAVSAGDVTLYVPAHDASPGRSASPGQTVRLRVSPSGVSLAAPTAEGETASTRNHLPGRVTAIAAAGDLLRVTLDAGVSITALVTQGAAKDLGLEVGQDLVARFKAAAVEVLSIR